MSELPFKALQKIVDEGTAGPITTAGPIGHAIESLDENLTEFVEFETISSNLPDIDESLLAGNCFFNYCILNEIGLRYHFLQCKNIAS